MFRLRWLSEPRLSPDGERAAVTVTCARPRAGPHRQPGGLAARRTATANCSRESPAAGRDHDPRWAPDGRRLAFVSDRSGRPEIWLVDTTAAVRAAAHATPPTGASGPSWSPDGGSIAFVAPDAGAGRPAGRYTRGAVPLEGRRGRRHRRARPRGTSGSCRRPAARPGSSPTVTGTTTCRASRRTADRRLPIQPDASGAGPARRRSCGWCRRAAASLRSLVPALGAIRMHAWSPDGTLDRLHRSSPGRGPGRQQRHLARRGGDRRRRAT